MCDLFNVNEAYESYNSMENLIASSLRGSLEVVTRLDVYKGRARMVIYLSIRKAMFSICKIS